MEIDHSSVPLSPQKAKLIDETLSLLLEEIKMNSSFQIATDRGDYDPQDYSLPELFTMDEQKKFSDDLKALYISERMKKREQIRLQRQDDYFRMKTALPLLQEKVREKVNQLINEGIIDSFTEDKITLRDLLTVRYHESKHSR